MRPLTDEETKALFAKLAEFLERNVKSLLERPDGDAHCFRLHKERVFYLRCARLGSLV